MLHRKNTHFASTITRHGHGSCSLCGDVMLLILDGLQSRENVSSELQLVHVGEEDKRQMLEALQRLQMEQTDAGDDTVEDVGAADCDWAEKLTDEQAQALLKVRFQHLYGFWSLYNLCCNSCLFLPGAPMANSIIHFADGRYLISY